jgi:signal transduction histidine kinase
VAEAERLVAICVVSAGCGALLPLRSGVFAVGALAAALAIAGADGMPVLLTTLAPWTAGRVVRSRRRLIAALAERNRQLAAEQDALAELAVRQERARIARELHDIVAHHLAVMVIHAGACRLGPPDGAARFAGIGDTGREALAELERLVELLNTDDPRPRNLETLLGQARAAGVRLHSRRCPTASASRPSCKTAPIASSKRG